MADSLYHWIKALHIIAVIAWMAGMLYLPRLFVYHSQVAAGSEASELFKAMERRLLRLIINPAMIVTWIAGLWLVHYTNALDPQNGIWMHGKLTLVIGMQIVHAMLARYRKAMMWSSRIAGGMLVIVGAMMATDTLRVLTQWLAGMTPEFLRGRL